MTTDTYLLYLAALAVFFASPPDTSQLLIISNSVRHGLRRSGWTIAGDLSANVCQMTVAAFGLAAVIGTSATAFQVVKWAGVAYLAWVGLQLILRPGGGRDVAAGGPTLAALFRQGFFTSAVNPFAVMFFAALFPQFIDPGVPVPPQLAVLGGTYLIVDGAILVLWGWLAAQAAGLVRAGSFRAVNRACGVMMIAAAALLAGRDPAPER